MEMNQTVNVVRHSVETSNNSDICDFLKVSDIENSIVVNGKMFILNHSSYFSKDFLEIYRKI